MVTTDADAGRDVISGIDLSGDRYTVRQKLFRSKYNVYDDAGTHILKARKKRFKMKEEFPFTTPDGDPVFTIKAGGILDHAGDYTLTDAETEEPIAILDKNFSFVVHKWKVRDPHDERLLATIESQSKLVEFLRLAPYVGIVANLIPHKYDIGGPDGEHFGAIEGQFSLRDEYEIHIEESGDAPKEALVAAAIAIDALEGN